MRVTHIHSSSHGPTETALLVEATEFYVTRADLITYTEMHKDAKVRALAKIPGFGIAHVEEGPGFDQNALIFNESVYRVLDTKAHLLAERRLANGRAVAVLVVRLEEIATGEQLLVAVVHLPAHVQDSDGWRVETRPVNVAVHKEATETLGWLAEEWVADPTLSGVIVTGDVNLHLERRWVRDYFDQHFPAELKLSWLGQFPGRRGTHHRRVIDATWTNMTVLDCHLMRDDDSSDHRPFREVLLTAPKLQEPEMKFVAYHEWSNRVRGATPSSHPLGATKGITAHWEGPRMGAFEHRECASKVRQIQSFHRDTRGWADIAYSAIVCPHGWVFEGRGPHTQTAANGTTDGNENFYAVCYLGGEGDGFTDAGKQGYLDAFAWLEREGDAGPIRNGHRDHKATACPGDAIYRWVHSLPAGAGTDTKDWFDMATLDDLKQAVGDAPIRFEGADGEVTEISLNRFLRHLETEQDRVKVRLGQIVNLLDIDALAAKVAAKVSVDADAEVVKQAVKDALAEGVA